MSPKMSNMRPETLPPKQHSPRHEIYKIVSETMALHFRKIDEKRDTVDKLYISRFFVILRCKPPKTPKSDATIHPETLQNPTKSMLEKQRVFGIDFGLILTPKMIPK